MYEVSSVCAPEASGVLGCRNENFEKGSVESTHKVPTSHYHTKHCHARWSCHSVDFAFEMS